MKTLITLALILSGLTTWTQDITLSLVDEDDYPVHFLLVKYVSEGDTSTTKTNFEGECYFYKKKEVTVFINSRYFEDTTFTITQNTKVKLKSSGIEMSEVVITASYDPEPIDSSTYSIKVISSEDIQNIGAVNLTDVLENQTNIRISQDNVLGTQIRMQGMDGENVKILVDGVPIIGRLDGNIDLSQINMDNVERIEIIDGPLSVEYGTNALAGTINIITKKNKRTTTARLKTYYESVGQYNISTTVGKNFKHFGASLNFGRNEFSGFSEPTDSIFLDGTSKPRNLTWKPKEQYFGTLSFNKNIKDSIQLRLSNEFMHEKITNLGSMRATTPTSDVTAFDDYYYTVRNTTTLNLDFKLKKNWAFKSVNSYNFYERKVEKYFKNLTTQEEINRGMDSKSTFDLVMFRGTFTKKKDSSKLNYQLGYDVNLESTRGDRIEGQFKNIHDYAAFASLQYYLNGLVIRPGIRASYNSAYSSSITPSLNIKKRIWKTLTARASYARGFRSPSLKELYMDFVDINHDVHGNPNLRPETLDAFTLGLKYKTHYNKLHVNTELKGFYNYVDDKISLIQVENSTHYEYSNIDKYQTLGGQINVATTLKQWKLNIGSTYTGIYNEIEGYAESARFYYSPDLQVNITRKIKKMDASVSLFFKYNGKASQYFINENDELELGFINPYELFDLTISKKIFKKKLTLNTGVKNIFDVTNIASSLQLAAHNSGSGSTSISWGRTFFLSLDYNFVKK